jgi:AhpD family alkylhydroperoxidase
MYEMSHLKRIGPLGQLAPESMAGFKALDTAALAEGAIPRKYKELMAIAIALTTQCPYCIEIHRNAAKSAGANDVELAETVFIAIALRAGAALTHGTHLFPA